MLPTLKVDSIVWANKLSYVKHPPLRGDVVVFHHPKTNDLYVKRVIGLPNESVMILGREIWIDGVKMESWLDISSDEYNKNEKYDKNNQNLYSVTSNIPPYTSFNILTSNHLQAWQVSGYWEVPEGHVFLMGDYRDESSDSRSWGAVDMDRIVGRMQFKIN